MAVARVHELTLVNTNGRTRNKAVVKDAESKYFIDGNVEEWNPLDAEGWKKINDS